MHRTKILFALITLAMLLTAANAQSRKFGNRSIAQAAGSTPANQSSQANDDDGPKNRIEGTWRADPEIFSDFKGLLTFGAGRDANQGIVVSSINFSFTGPFSCLNEQGTWKKAGDRSFIGTDEGFCFDSSNPGFLPAGKVKLRYAINLNKAGTQFDGTAQAEILDTFGNVLESFGGPVHAVRMQAEAPTP